MVIDVVLIARLDTALKNAHPANDVEANELDDLRKSLGNLPSEEVEEQ